MWCWEVLAARSGLPPALVVREPRDSANEQNNADLQVIAWTFITGFSFRANLFFLDLSPFSLPLHFLFTWHTTTSQTI
jgi:hypothetical protein